MLRLKVGLCPSLTHSTYNKLVSLNICTVTQFLSHDIDQLSAKSDISLRDLVSIRRYVIAQHSCPPIDALQLYHNIVASVCILSTGCSDLDSLLDGGVYSGELTEIRGNRGKTQICMNIAASVTTGMSKDVTYFDSGGNFNLFRFTKLVEASPMNDDEETTLKRVTHITIFDVFDFFRKLEQLRCAMLGETEGITLKLVIVDCMSELFLQYTAGLKNDSYCGYVMQAMRMLKSLAADFCIAVIITNNTCDERLSQICTTMVNTSLQVQMVEPGLNSDACAVNSNVMSVEMIRSNRVVSGICTKVLVNDSGLQSATGCLNS